MKTKIVILSLSLMFGLSTLSKAQCNAGNDSVICGITINLNAEGNPLNQLQNWSCVSPGVTINQPSSPTSNVIVPTSGTYTFTWSITDEVGSTCTDDVNITFGQNPTSFFTFTNNVQVGDTVTVTYTGTSGWPSSCSWDFYPGNVISGNGFGPYQIVYSTPGQFSISLIVLNNNCSSFLAYDIVIFPTCNANAGPDQTVCGLTATLMPILNGNETQYNWSCLSPNVTFNNPTFPNTNVTVSSTGTYTFVWTEICSSGYMDSDSVIIVFDNLLHVEAGPYQSVCGYTAQLEADTLGTGILLGSWTSSVPGIIITPAVVGNVESTVTVDATPVATQFQNSMLGVWFYWTGTNSLGCSAIDSLLVNFYEVPNAFAGADDSVCGKNYDLLGEFSLENSVGTWTILQMPFFTSTADIQPANYPDGEVTSADYGIYLFIWRESNAGNTSCIDRDTIEINFMDIPHPDAGLDFSVCGKYAELNATPTIGNGYWTAPTSSWFNATAWHAGDTTYCATCYNEHNVVYYYPSENDTVTMYWMEFDGICYGYDSVNVYFGSIEAAVTLVDPVDTVVCGLIFTGLNAQMPAYGGGYWYDNENNTQFFPVENNLPNPDSAYVSYTSSEMHYFYWVTSNGLCGDTSEAVPVRFKKAGGVLGHISNLNNYNNIYVGIYESGNPYRKFGAVSDSNGNYFSYADPGEYFLKVDVINPNLLSGIASTYYGDAWQWNEAITINVPVCDTITADINMYTFSQAAGGIGQISGLVTYDGGEPVENVNVYLQTEPTDELAGLQLTSGNGDYSFVNIPNGDYKIHVDIPGLPQVTTYNISITPTDTVFPNINFIVDTTIFKDYGYGIYADSNFVNSIGNLQSLNSVMQLYPVPFHQDLNLVISHDGHFNIEWYDVTGRLYSSTEKDLTTGTNKMDLPVDLPKGVCYVKITEGNTVYVKKLMRE